MALWRVRIASLQTWRVAHRARASVRLHIGEAAAARLGVGDGDQAVAADALARAQRKALDGFFGRDCVPSSTDWPRCAPTREGGRRRLLASWAEVYRVDVFAKQSDGGGVTSSYDRYLSTVGAMLGVYQLKVWRV